jgi:thioredoxin reductase
MYDLVIIGGGAASQAAAMYALGKRINFLLICEHFGGRVTEPSEPIDRDYQVSNILVHFDRPDAEDEERRLIGSSAVNLFARQLGWKPEHLREGQVVSVDRVGNQYMIETADGERFSAGAVILATGATPRRLEGVAGADLVEPLGHRASCHAAALAGREVAVIGAGEQAVYYAAELAETALRVYLVLPNEAAAERPDVALLARRRNVELLPGFQPVAIRGDAERQSLLVGREQELVDLAVTATFADLGAEPASALVRHLARTGPDGFVQVDRGFATSAPGLFAAGDVTCPEGEQVLATIGDGARAARSAHFYLLTRPTARVVGQA